MFSFLQNSSITRSSSFSVIHVSVNIKNNVEKRHDFVVVFSLLKSRRPCDFFPNETLSCISVAIAVDWNYFTLVCLWCRRTLGRSVGRCTVTWLPNFLRWVVYHFFLPMVLRCARFVRQSSAKKKIKKLMFSMKSLTFSCLISKVAQKGKIARGCWNRKKLLQTTKVAEKLPSAIGKGLVTNNKSRHAPLACSKQKWRTTRRLLRFSAFQTKLFQDLNLPM